MLDSQKINHTRNEQSRIHAENINNLKNFLEQFNDEIITVLAEKIIASDKFIKLTKLSQDVNLIRLALYAVVFIIVWLLSNIQIIWISVATIYPLKILQQIKTGEEQIILLFYYSLIGTMTVLEPILYFLVEKILPLYGCLRYIFVIWLLKNNRDGCKFLYELFFIRFLEFDADKTKEQLLDVVDKVSNRNF